MDTSKAKWDLSKDEQYAIRWFDGHGFEGELVKQYVSKTIFNVKKDGVADRFELPQGGHYDISSYMEQYDKTFEMIRLMERK